MKKLILLGICLMSLSLLVGCGNGQSNIVASTTISQNKIQTVPVKKELTIQTGLQNLGKGRIIITTPSSTSGNENIPVIFIQSDTILTQIGLDGLNMQSDKETYIYIDGIFKSKNQFGERTQISLDIDGKISKGIHVVTVAEYIDNDPTKPIVEYHEVKFEVK